MPNHVTNIVEITGHERHVQDLFDAVKYENENGDVQEFAFEAFLPMPKELRHVTSPTRIVTKKEYEKEINEAGMKNHPFGFSHSITKAMSKDYIRRFGHDNWYDWAIANWGTKWGAYDVQVDGNVIIFLTAWSGAVVAMQQLSYKFPNVTIKLTYADEDVGANTGVVIFKEGGAIEEFYPETGSDEAMEIYFRCCGGEEFWEKRDGEWCYIDD